MVSRSRAGFTLNIIDTPGLIEGGYINDMALDIIKRYVSLQYVSQHLTPHAGLSLNAYSFYPLILSFSLVGMCGF